MSGLTPEDVSKLAFHALHPDQPQRHCDRNEERTDGPTRRLVEAGMVRTSGTGKGYMAPCSYVTPEGIKAAAMLPRWWAVSENGNTWKIRRIGAGFLGSGIVVGKHDVQHVLDALQVAE